MRITGLATGMDMDNIIKESMKPYQIKVDQTTQKKDVVEIKQKLYRDIIKDSREFLSKNLDIVKSDSLLKAANWGAVSFSSSDENAVTATASGGAIKDNYTVSVSQLAQSASAKISDITSTTKISIQAKDSAGTDKTIIVEKGTNSDDDFIKELNTKLADVGMTAKKSEIAGGLILETKTTGADKSFKFAVNSDVPTDLASGKNLNATITNSKGTYTISDTQNKTTSNTVTLDGITFNFNKEGVAGVTLTGKTDLTALKDKIVGFVNDYNKLIEKLNTTVSTKHDRSYNPLTADQKKDMSETEVKLWNERVEKGQLYKDSDITRVADSMKEAMRTLMSDTGLNLESIGISPVKDYSGTLNGTFTIDEDKLKTSLENNTEDVMNLFIANPTSKEPSKTGVLQKLKDTLDKEVMKSSSSPLLKKAGFEGTSTFSNNELTKSVADYEKKIKNMQTDFSRREQALYSKYATLEKMMNNLNAQQSNLMSQLGMS